MPISRCLYPSSRPALRRSDPARESPSSRKWKIAPADRCLSSSAPYRRDRCRDKAEEMASGQRLDVKLMEQIATEASRAVDPIDDLRGSADYKRHLVQVLVPRALSTVRKSKRKTHNGCGWNQCNDGGVVWPRLRARSITLGSGAAARCSTPKRCAVHTLTPIYCESMPAKQRNCRASSP